jgi:hypothetical protein
MPIITDRLFGLTEGLVNRPSICDVLEQHRRSVLKKIDDVCSTDELTDKFLVDLIAKSIVEPLHIRFGERTQNQRTEEVPYNYGQRRMVVVRITVPFSGDQTLLKFVPSRLSLQYPIGRVEKNTIQFDKPLASSEEGVRLAQSIDEDLSRIAEFAAYANADAKDINDQLPNRLKTAFDVRLIELAKQQEILDSLNIPLTPEPPPQEIPISSTPATKTQKERAAIIVLQVQQMTVQQLTQINYNAGDVNNELQSGEQQQG